jgi:hypothetical protein
MIAAPPLDRDNARLRGGVVASVRAQIRAIWFPENT